MILLYIYLLLNIINEYTKDKYLNAAKQLWVYTLTCWGFVEGAGTSCVGMDGVRTGTFASGVGW